MQYHYSLFRVIFREGRAGKGQRLEYCAYVNRVSKMEQDSALTGI